MRGLVLISAGIVLHPQSILPDFRPIACFVILFLGVRELLADFASRRNRGVTEQLSH